MKFTYSKFEVRIKKRFFIFVFFCIFAGIFLLINQVNINTLHTKNEGSVLAVSEGQKSSYDLIAPEATTYEDSNVSKNFEPVTISHTVKEGDTIYSVATKYNTDSQSIVDYPYNEIGDDFNLAPGQILIIPYGWIDSPEFLQDIARGSGQFLWPTKGIISQYAFWWHPGAIDIAAKLGEPIGAAETGKVITVLKIGTGYGHHVILDHGNGLTTLYAHMSEVLVTEGDWVEKGQMLGSVGSTGRSTGPHLHFEVRRGSEPIDPMTLLR